MGKSFIQNRKKSRKYFSAHQYQNSTLTVCDGAKQIYPKKQKKDSKKRYSTNFSISRPEVYCKKCKKGVLKNFATSLFGYQ